MSRLAKPKELLLRFKMFLPDLSKKMDVCWENRIHLLFEQWKLKNALSICLKNLFKLRNWRNEPDNDDNQDCGTVNQYGRFADDFCNNKYGYICQFTAPTGTYK